MTENELRQFLVEAREALDAGVDETPDWVLKIEIAKDICVTDDEWHALQRGLSRVIVEHFVARSGSG
jgi:hypothetical protein